MEGAESEKRKKERSQSFPGIGTPTFSSIAESKTKLVDTLVNNGSVPGLVTREISMPSMNSRESPEKISNITFNSTRHRSSTSISHDQSSTWELNQLCESLSEKDPQKIVSTGNELAELLKCNPELRQILNLSAFGHRISELWINPTAEVAATGYRIARLIMHDMDSLMFISGLRLDLFVTLSLSKDAAHSIEKEQAIRLIRAFLEIEGGAKELSLGVVKAFVAIAEEKDDKFRNICIESIAEFCVVNPEVVFKSGGLRILFHCVQEGPYDLSMPCLMALIHVLNLPDSRPFLRGGVDMISLISPFSDMDVKSHSSIEKLQNTAFLLTVFLKSWVGLVSVSSNNFRPIKELIECLSRENPTLRDILMDVFFDILKIRTLPWLGTLLSNRKIFSTIPTKQLLNLPEHSFRISNHYTTLILAILLDGGIMTQLFSIIQNSTDDLNARKAAFLLTEIYSLTSTFLPNESLGDKQKLPSVIEYAEYKEGDKFISLTPAFEIEKVTRSVNKDRSVLGKAAKINENLLNYTREVKVKMKYNVDDLQFKSMVTKTKVLTSKIYSQWNWDILIELIQGPLMNPRRFEELNKTTKFVKRLMSYYRPFKFRFSSTKRSKASIKYIKAGTELIKMFLSNSDGVKFLQDNKLLPQVAECLAQVDKYSGITATEPVFSKERLNTTLSVGYFEMLGILSSDVNGIRMLEKWQIFTMLYHIIEKGGREDLIIYILENFQYTRNNHSRVLFNKALTSCDLNIRIFATRHISELLKLRECKDWIIRLLVDQLYDSSLLVCSTALSILDEYCSDLDNLDQVIRLRPSFGHLGDLAIPLYIKFLSSTLGFYYLNDFNFVENEMNEWVNRKNQQYAIEIERALLLEYFPYAARPDVLHDNTSMPLHFFGELVKTEEGLILLSQSGHFQNFLDDILYYKDSGLEDPQSILRLKSALWAIGNIGSTEYGITLLDESDITKVLIDMAVNSEIWSIKGTSFFVLGLLASTQEGIEILDELNWISSVGIMNNPLGYCLPKELNEFLYVTPQNPYESDESSPTSEESELGNDGPEETNGQEEEISMESIHRRIVSLIKSLNVVLSKIEKGAAKELMKLSSKSKEIFENPDLLLDVVGVLENGHYKLHVRKFIFELFLGTRVLEMTVKRDRRRSRDAKDLEKFERSKFT